MSYFKIMNEDQLKEMIDQYRPMLENPDMFERGLLALVKDVEREVRHRSVRLAQDFANQLSDALSEPVQNKSKKAITKNDCSM